ncbi:helix-turn-helix domain-containing protein [Sphingobium sp. SA2]|uniref:helix-turn-helix transcriptional regulator n=1 Tax=Sphingobium sp. SA2 TaxID=1524832 RepID=UPI0028C1DB93|nr:helix-turn-helix domain-containing protein [Sphingobium sp. SA2]MDT7535372.1 helix-turn-helix domain-containing protein [Sphingobium sp. SA2]
MTTDIFDTRGAGGYCGLSKPTMERFRLTGDGPVYVKLGKAVRYRKADLDAW